MQGNYTLVTPYEKVREVWKTIKTACVLGLTLMTVEGVWRLVSVRVVVTPTGG